MVKSGVNCAREGLLAAAGTLDDDDDDGINESPVPVTGCATTGGIVCGEDVAGLLLLLVAVPAATLGVCIIGESADAV
jgi:hypothetical protein